jgi:hypothetical protein
MRKPKLLLAGLVSLLLALGVIGSQGAQAQSSGWGSCTGGLCYTGGNVGINNLAPGTKLDVNGTVRSKAPSDGATTFLITPNNGTSQSFSMTATNGGGLFFGRLSGSGGINTDMFIGPSGSVLFKSPANGVVTNVIAPNDGVSQSYGMTSVNGGGFYLGHTAGVGQGVGSEFRIYGNGDICLGNCP